MFRHRTDQPLEEIAIAHDYLTQKGGAERVVLTMLKAYPEATIYTTLYDPENTFPEFKDAKIVVSPLNKVGILRRNHRLALPLLPLASSFLKVAAKKTLVSSTGWAHGFNFAGKSFIYCHSPARWLYLSDQYLGDESKKPVEVALKALRPVLTLWDKRAARKAGPYVANSTIIQKRIADCYGKRAEILFPPHSVSTDGAQKPITGLEEFLAGDYFLIVSRLLPYKNVDKAVRAFNTMTDKKLLVIGAGPEKENLQALAGENIRFASQISDEEMRYAYANCTALLAVSFEDFGLTPIEAGSFGKPTIALQAGGYLDTIVEGTNGVFIKESTAENIKEAVEGFRASDWSAEKIQQHVDSFSEAHFIERIKNYMSNL